MRAKPSNAALIVRGQVKQVSRLVKMLPLAPGAMDSVFIITA
jgi:hypothetical protein